MDTLVNTTYQGWSNRETWLAYLWLTNDEQSYSLLRETSHAGGDLFEQAERLEEQLRDQLDDEASEANMWCDLLTTAFDRINWLEVVEHV